MRAQKKPQAKGKVSVLLIEQRGARRTIWGYYDFGSVPSVGDTIRIYNQQTILLVIAVEHSPRPSIDRDKPQPESLVSVIAEACGKQVNRPES